MSIATDFTKSSRILYGMFLNAPIISSNQLWSAYSSEKPLLQIEHLKASQVKKKKKPPEDEEMKENRNEHVDIRNIHTEPIITDGKCIHEVTVSSLAKLKKLKAAESPPAKTYNFTLDSFQKQAILCIENDQSVLVSAHTSAGKTVVAEYAIALSLKRKQRVIYTTPIKALSNQKYRELLDEFTDVGLMTGDVTMQPSASCIVMTTEILRSMLYRGSEMIKEVGWVVFDEIHYMRDPTRGVVWEETLILLPHNVRYVFLSATIPNARQFAEWVTYIHDQPCNVVYTEFRPTPLEHYLYHTTKKELILVFNEKGLNENNFDAAFEIEIEPNNVNPNDPQQKSILFYLITDLMKKNWAPIIVFSFSRNECEEHAMKMLQLNFNTAEEQKLVDEIFNNAVSILAESEKDLPHVSSIIPLLRRGIAFHHSGLLPFIKETIEILFGEGLIKVLFATETFSMGLNMPAKTVVFTTVNKYDGLSDRVITSGEYIQMSGRAGRRGIDDKGIVITILKQTPKIKIKEILIGKTDPLNSAFHLTYNMILNLLRLEEINPEYLIEKSFLNFQNKKRIIEKSSLLSEKQEQHDNISISYEATLMSYTKIKKKLSTLHSTMRNFIAKPRYLINVLQPGRLIKLKSDVHEYDWGILMHNKKENFQKKKYENNVTDVDEESLTITILLLIDQNYDKFPLPKYLPNPFYNNKEPVLQTFTVDHKLVYQICSEVVDTTVFKMRHADKKAAFMNIMNNFKDIYPHGFPLLHPIFDMNITDPEIPNLIDKINNLENTLMNHSCIKHKNKKKSLEDYELKERLSKEIKILHKEIKDMSSAITLKELQQRKIVLRELGYCDEADIISMKGRVACEFSANELLLSEMVFHGILNKIPVNHCVALLSCLLCTGEIGPFCPQMSDTFQEVQSLIKVISKVCYEANLLTSANEKLLDFSPSMIDVMLAWCNGASFLEICKITFLYEGAIIRNMRGIEEILMELYKAAKNIGNIDLEVKFSEGIKRLKRGIVFTASLYL